MNSSTSQTPSSSDTKVLDLGAFRRKKALDQATADGRKPLYASHLDRQVDSSPKSQQGKGEDFGDRMQRIRTSLERINTLMAELRRMSNSRGQ